MNSLSDACAAADWPEEAIPPSPSRKNHPRAPVDTHVVLYGEPQLQLMSRPRSSGMPSFLDDLFTAGSAQCREALVRDRLHRLGFEWLLHATATQGMGGPPSAAIFTTYAHAAWLQRCLGKEYHLVDPRWHSAPPTGIPLVWDVQDIEAHPRVQRSGQRGRRFMEDFRSNRNGSGIFFRVASPVPTRELAYVSFTSSAPHREWIDGEVLGQAVMLGLCLHEFLSQHVRRPEVVPPRSAAALPSVQEDMIQCLSQGLSNKEIARALRLSLHAVDYHLRQLRRRFAVRNRTQLVKAATSGRPREQLVGIAPARAAGSESGSHATVASPAADRLTGTRYPWPVVPPHLPS